MGWHRGIIIKGGSYNNKPELKALVQTVLRRMFPPESYQYAGVLGTTIKMRITRYKKTGRRCKGARGYIHCYHHEDVARIRRS